MESMVVIERLNELLLGKHYLCFTVGATFDLNFDGFHLACQELLAQDEALVNQSFVDRYQPGQDSANKELVAKSAMLATCLFRTVTRVKAKADSSLVIGFENGVAFTIPTNTPTVDWHWAITEDDRDPYLGSIVACFSAGEIT
jgi:hypothetical protein